jgi:hypothetical protein
VGNSDRNAKAAPPSARQSLAYHTGYTALDVGRSGNITSVEIASARGEDIRDYFGCVATQLLSVIFWYELEEAQLQYPGGGFVVGMRLVNVFAMFGPFQHWSLAAGGVKPR